jgi:mRNA-degrading endonuclease RelE of RelBE toxin-antitoxin system
MKPTKSTPVKDRLSHSTTSSANYKVIPTDIFISEAKKLAKKYPNIREDFRELQKQLKKDPITGNYSLGQDCYKVRMAISDKNQGESGGARVIIEVKIIAKIVYVLSVFDKSYKENLVDGELKKLLNKRKKEIK